MGYNAHGLLQAYVSVLPLAKASGLALFIVDRHHQFPSPILEGGGPLSAKRIFFTTG